MRRSMLVSTGELSPVLLWLLLCVNHLADTSDVRYNVNQTCTMEQYHAYLCMPET